MANNVDVFDNDEVERTFKTTETGGVHVSHVNVDSIPLASDAATATKQDTIIGHVDGLEGLLSTIDADTSILAGAVSSTRVQTNPISGQVGVAGGTGTASSTTQRVVLASNDTLVTTVGATTDSAATDETSTATVVGVLKGIHRELRDTDAVLVTSPSSVFDVVLSTDTSAYASGDLLADTQVMTAAMRADNLGGVLQSLTVIDKADQKVAMTIYFLSANATMGTENSAPSISDANAANILGYVDIAAADWKDLGGVAVVTVKGIGIGLRPASGTDDCYIAAVNGSGTPTFAADSLVVRATILRD